MSGDNETRLLDLLRRIEFSLAAVERGMDKLVELNTEAITTMRKRELEYLTRDLINAREYLQRHGYSVLDVTTSSDAERAEATSEP